LIPAFTLAGGALGGLAGKELGKEAKRRITMPLPRDSVGGRARLGADPRTFTPLPAPMLPVVRTPKKFITPRNELERAKMAREPEMSYV
jgi:hypothetical protein